MPLPSQEDETITEDSSGSCGKNGKGGGKGRESSVEASRVDWITKKH